MKIPSWVTWAALGALAYLIYTNPAGVGHFVSQVLHSIGVLLHSL